MKKISCIKKGSVKTKLIVSVTLLLATVIFGCWFMNMAFLPTYYQYRKVSMLSSSYDKVNKIVSADSDFVNKGANLSDTSLLALEILSENSSMNVYMFDISNFFGQLAYTFDYPANDHMNDLQMQDVKEKTELYVSAMVTGQMNNMRNHELIRKTKQYYVFKVYDKRIGSYYLEMFGRLKSGSYVFMSTNFQSMTENVAISNRFLGYVGIACIILGIVVMVFIGDSFVKPLKKMTGIAHRMTNLDFEAKYPVNTKDEIGELGTSINTLSEQLETTISELKTANNELQTDIEHKIQIDEMRKEFLSNVSHELKTPIALIQGYAEGLHDNINDDEESREFYCSVIMDEAAKMNKMVKKLLTLNQIEFGKNQVTFERFDIIQVLKSAIQSAKLLADQKDATIIMEDYKPNFVWADEYMTEEVITNYISNAINHVDGEKNIIVKAENREKVVYISVFNTGQCIPEDDLEKIWIKFYKVDKARTRAYGGSGIGLSIVKAIVEAMNQKCGVINHKDGVEFWFELDRGNDVG